MAEPVPSAHLTEFIRELQGKPPVADAITTIKNFCQLLASYDITEVIGEYDGSGDSGDMTISVKMSVPCPPGNRLDSADYAPNPAIYRQFCTVVDSLIAKPNSLITQENYAAFEDAMFNLLPGGWEINDGSFGEIHVTVGTGHVHTEHNERYTDVTHTESNYP
jgi:hypothetical protein